MGIEGRDLVDLGERELHLLRQGGEMRGREIIVAVLDQMQMLDEEIAPAFAIAEQRPHPPHARRIDLAAFRGARRAAASGFPRSSGGNVGGGSVRFIGPL